MTSPSPLDLRPSQDAMSHAEVEAASKPRICNVCQEAFMVPDGAEDLRVRAHQRDTAFSMHVVNKHAQELAARSAGPPDVVADSGFRPGAPVPAPSGPHFQGESVSDRNAPPAFVGETPQGGGHPGVNLPVFKHITGQGGGHPMSASAPQGGTVVQFNQSPRYAPSEAFQATDGVAMNDPTRPLGEGSVLQGGTPPVVGPPSQIFQAVDGHVVNAGGPAPTALPNQFRGQNSTMGDPNAPVPVRTYAQGPAYPTPYPQAYQPPPGYALVPTAPSPPPALQRFQVPPGYMLVPEHTAAVPSPASAPSRSGEVDDFGFPSDGDLTKLAATMLRKVLKRLAEGVDVSEQGHILGLVRNAEQLLLAAFKNT